MLAPIATAQQPLQMPPPVLVDPNAGGVRVVENGIVANWYAGSKRKSLRPVVLLLGGSEGGIGVGTARQAANLVAHGFSVLQIAYFGALGLPSKLDLIPLEYFDRALDWIKHQRGGRYQAYSNRWRLQRSRGRTACGIAAS